MDYKTMKIDDIIAYCQEHGEVKWLKAKAAEKVGDRKINFFELKDAFVMKFMPEIKPEKKPQQPTMYDKIAAL